VKHTRVLAAGLFALLASCSDTTDPETLTEPGTVAFSFSGASGSSFDVTGAPPVNQSQALTTSWSVGARDNSDGFVTVLSVRARSGGLFDEVYMAIPRLTAGSATVDVNNCTTDCAEFVFTIGAPTSGAVQWEYFCEMEAGTLTISTISSQRVTGTFSGIGVCTDDNLDDTNFAVSGGTFDVALASTGMLLRR